jgi:hypothetical protein
VTYLPPISVGAGALLDYLAGTALALLLLSSIQIFRGKRWIWLVPILFLVVGLTVAPNSPGTNWGVWVAVGVATATAIGLVGFLCLKLGWAIFPGVMAAPTILEQAEILLTRPFPGSFPGALLGLVLVGVAMVYWTRALEGPDPMARQKEGGDPHLSHSGP